MIILRCSKNQTDDYLDGGDNGDNDEPEPEEHVYLLVDDVEGQHAQRIQLLDRAGATELVELALGHLHCKNSVITYIFDLVGHMGKCLKSNRDGYGTYQLPYYQLSTSD